ncbi:hypothetical protein ABT294_33075 [Nonomuraea sp. NPDC000554]|uniref:hypothetical protein n=1 Tax=Nonomuraea sp. NPDC000554 TaxID=3154259 RepID=UPI00331DE367
MTPEQPGHQDLNRTIRHRWPAPPGQRQPQQPSSTRRLPYTPDMFPDVRQYEARPARSGWWWVIAIGGLALLMAAIAIAAILWLRGNAAAPGKPSAGPPRITDTTARVSYLLPGGWKQAARQPFTSGISAGGSVVLAFPQQQGEVGGAQSSVLLQSQANDVALQTARTLMPDVSSRDDLRTRALQLGGQPAATASFRVLFRSATKDPAYVRIVAVHTPDGTVSYVYGSAAPDSEAARQALDQVLDSVTPA